MSPELHQRVRKVFDEALELPLAERIAFAKTACADDPSVLEAVLRLLEAHRESESFLEDEAPRKQRIGRYVVTGELGRGSMGVVYDAMDPLIARAVAIKVIHLETATEPGQAESMKERLFREARTAGSLFHPGIVTIFDVGEDGDTAYIAMERVDGQSLDKVLASGRKMSPAESLNILRRTAAALDFAHQNGVVHRDIKPANIILQQDSSVKVADFGIAKVATNPHQTQANVKKGTPSYMSPEQIEGRPVDGRSDQFSLAVLGFLLLTGYRLFEGDSFAALMHNVVHGPRPSARALNPALPAAVDDVMRRGLAADREERYPTCGDFVDALDAALKAPEVVKVPEPSVPRVPIVRQVNESVSVRKNSPVPVPTRSQTPLPFMLALGSASIIVLIAGVAVFRMLSSHQPPIAPVTSLPAVPEPVNEPRHPATGAVPQSRRLFDDAVAKRTANQNPEALVLFRQAAELGDVQAMFQTGQMFMDGQGTTRNRVEAAKWFRQAADSGNVRSMLFLGSMYLLGSGLPQDAAEAATWFRKAADQGDPSGMFDLGTLYEKGRGVPEDLGLARDFYQKAADRGNAEARKRLAQLPSLPR